MISLNPLLLVGGVIGTVSVLLLIAYACVIIVLSGSRAALAALAGVAVLHGWRLLRERAGGRGVLALLLAGGGWYLAGPGSSGGSPPASGNTGRAH